MDPQILYHGHWQHETAKSHGTSKYRKMRGQQPLAICIHNSKFSCLDGMREAYSAQAHALWGHRAAALPGSHPLWWLQSWYPRIAQGVSEWEYQMLPTVGELAASSARVCNLAACACIQDRPSVMGKLAPSSMTENCRGYVPRSFWSWGPTSPSY